MNADSNYAYLRALLPEMERQTTDTIFLVFFPDPTRGRGRWVYQPDGLQTDRVRFVRWHYDTAMRTGTLAFDPERFADIDNNHGPVIYWMHQVESAALFHGGYRQSFNPSSRPSMVAQHHYIIHDTLPHNVDGLFPRMWAQMGGSLAADRVVYNSNHARKMARETFTKWLSFERFKWLDDKSLTLPFGLVADDQPIAPIAMADDPITVLYNHRFESYKQPQVTFDIFESLRARHEFNVIATMAGNSKTGGRRQYQFDNAIFEPDRGDYLRRIAQPAINTINSVHETYCISMVDSIAAGHLVVVPNAVTFPELVPPDYPFKFDDVAQQKNMLNHIMRTWPSEYNTWRERLAQHARERFNVQRYAADYLGIFADAERPYRDHKPKPSTVKTFNRIWDGMKPGVGYEPREFRKQIPRAGSKQAGDQAYSTRRIIRDSLTFRDDIGVRWESNGVRLFRRT